jgi:hypothetical protein
MFHISLRHVLRLVEVTELQESRHSLNSFRNSHAARRTYHSRSSSYGSSPSLRTKQKRMQGSFTCKELSRSIEKPYYVNSGSVFMTFHKKYCDISAGSYSCEASGCPLLRNGSLNISVSRQHSVLHVSACYRGNRSWHNIKRAVVMCMSECRRGFGLDIGFIDHFNTQLTNTLNYSAIANFHIILIN